MTERGTMGALQQPVRAVALRLFDGEWHPIELPAGAKGPPPEGRTGYAGTDMTRAEVEAAAWVGNIGVRMPADVIGLDIDVYRGGADTLNELFALYGPLPPTWISHSSRDDGSGIRFVRVPSGLAWVASLAGIDLIQRGHRYAVVAPSTHPDGRRYGVWDQAAEEPGELPRVDDLPELPWPWINALSRVNRDDVAAGGRALAAGAEEVQGFIETSTAAEAPGYIAVIVSHFVNRVEVGYSRHDTMQHCLLWALECCRAGIADAATAIAALADVWVAAVEPDRRRAELHSGRRVTEFDAMVRHAVGKVNAKSPEEMDRLHDDIAGPRFNVPATIAGIGQDAHEPVADGLPPTSTPLTRLTFGPLPKPFVVPRIEWHAEAFLARPTHGELAGAEKTLKSYTGLCIDVALAAGLPIFGRFTVPEPQRVVLLVGEGGEGPWLTRVAAVCEAYGIAPEDITGNVRFTASTASVTSPRFLDGVLAELETFGPALVHLDPWYAYAGGQTDSRQVAEVGASLATVGDLCASHGATLLINHHFNRQGVEGLRGITGAGHAEWVDSWLLVKHRVPADVADGHYRLRLDVGSRQWGGGAYDLDYDINQLTGRLGWRINEASAADPADRGDPLADVKLELLRVGHESPNPEPMTKASWTVRVKRRAGERSVAFDELVRGGFLTPERTERHGTRTVTLFVLSDQARRMLSTGPE